MMKKLLHSYHTYAFFAVMMWAASFLWTKLALRDYAAMSIAALRLLTASVFLAVILLLRKKKTGAKAGKTVEEPLWKSLLCFAPSGFFGFALYQICFNQGNSKLTSATMSILISTAPVLTAVLGRIILKEKLTMKKYAAILICFVGVLVMTFFNLSLTGTGVLWGIAGACCLASYYLYQRSYSDRYDAMFSTSVSIFWAALIMSWQLPRAFAEMAKASAIPTSMVFLMGITCSALGYCAWGKALSMADTASSVTNYKFLEPFIAAALGWVFLRETLTWPTLLGGGLIMAGLVLFNWKERTRSRS